MKPNTIEDIRRCFSASEDFNEIFDAFESAIAQRICDVEPYRLLFWNPSLTSDEVRLFGEKLSAEFPELAYDVFSWLASIFEAIHSASDNHELALYYYKKAANVRPAEPDPYLDACDCYDPDLNIPPLDSLIEFVKQGVLTVVHPSPLYKRLARLHEIAGDFDQAELCRKKADALDIPPHGDAPSA